MRTNRTLQALTHDRLIAIQNENATLTYFVEWGPMIDADTIVTSSWSSDGNIAIASESNTTTKTQATLSGAIGTYRIVNKITTPTQTDERIIILTILNNDDYLRDYE